MENKQNGWYLDPETQKVARSLDDLVAGLTESFANAVRDRVVFVVEAGSSPQAQNKKVFVSHSEIRKAARENCEAPEERDYDYLFVTGARWMEERLDKASGDCEKLISAVKGALRYLESCGYSKPNPSESNFTEPEHAMYKDLEKALLNTEAELSPEMAHAIEALNNIAYGDELTKVLGHPEVAMGALNAIEAMRASKGLSGFPRGRVTNDGASK